MRRFAIALRSWFFTLPTIVIATVVMGLLSLIASLFDHAGESQHRLAQAWSRMLLRIGFVRVVTHDLGKLDPGSSYVLVANHSSYYDTPVILASLPLQFRFFAKKGLFQIPLLGTHMQRAGYFPVIRGDPRASLKAMADGARQIQEKRISVLLFSEGGRSEDSLREFKEGAAHIAIKAGVPLVPVGIRGARKVLAMHTIHVLPGTIELYVGDPIETTGLGARDRTAITRQALQQIADMIGEPAPNSSLDGKSVVPGKASLA